MKKQLFILLLLVILSASSCQQEGNQSDAERYKPAWESLKQHQTPQWLRDGKFGIYTHWGVYSVPAHGNNATWFSYGVYRNEDGEYRKWHEFGYYEYTGKNFEADMAELANEPRNIEWLKTCDPMQIPLTGEKGWRVMEQVYLNE